MTDKIHVFLSTSAPVKAASCWVAKQQATKWAGNPDVSQYPAAGLSNCGYESDSPRVD